MIIDFHTHAFPEKIAARALADLKMNINIEPCTNGTVDDLLSVLHENNIDVGVELNIAVKEGSEKTINKTAFENAEKYSGKLVPFGSVNPKSENALLVIDEIASMGLKGIKLHPEYQKFFIDDEKYLKIYERALSRGLIIIFHAGFDPYVPQSDMAGSTRCAKIADLYKGEKMVFAHMGSNCNISDAKNLFSGKNVYLDTSFCATSCKTQQDRDDFISLVKSIGSDKILLGSDCPWENPKESIKFINDLSIDEETKKKILGENAKKLLNIK